MVKREILDSFKKLNLKQYIDKTLTNTDKSILKTELHKHEKIEKEIKDEMFKTYSANIDHLVDILDKTHKINKLYEEIQDDLVEYRSVFRYFEKDDDDGSYVDNEKQKEFRELISKFDKEAEVFVTEKRYVLHSDVFYAEEENMKKSFMLMFCNDLLIIGKKTANKYVLKNAFNYSVIKVNGDDDKLIITVDPFEFVYQKDKTSVDRAVEVYKEVTYKNKAVDDRPKDNKNDDSEIVDYLIFTEQYDKLVNYKACINTDIDFENIKIDSTILPQFLDVFSTDKSRKKFFYKYLSNTIEKRLFNVDIVQKLDGLITDIFIEFHDFCREARKLFDDYCVKYGNKRSDEAVFILFINYQIQSIFNMLRKRIFGKHSSIENVNNYIDMIRDKLYFLGYDFRYMIDMFDKDKKEKQEQSYEETKEAIIKLLDEMVVEEYL